MKVGETGYVFVINRDGSFISHPSHESTEKVQEAEGGALAGFYDKIVRDGKASEIVSVGLSLIHIWILRMVSTFSRKLN